MENRPKSRKRNYSGKSVSVFSSSTSNSGSNIIRGGSGLSLIGIVLFVIYSLVFKQPTTNTQSIINTLPVSSAEYNIVNDKEVNYSVDDLSREKYTILNGDGSDKVTIMIYMVGSDLESRYGMATKDLNEILYYIDAKSTTTKKGQSDKTEIFWRNSEWNFIETKNPNNYLIARVFNCNSDNYEIVYLEIKKKDLFTI